jgi:hypothetical protein
MGLLNDAERAAFAQLSSWTRGRDDDFTLTEIPGSATTGWITVFCRSTRVARTYSIGRSSSWLNLFRRDLEAGIFDR